MQETTIRVDRERPIATVTLARPKQRNAFTQQMIAELTATFETLGGDDTVRVVVLAGEGPVFSAGADVRYMRSAAYFDHDENVADALLLADLFSAITDCPKPIVGRVHGAAMGGGVGLVATCDIAVAAEGTRFAISEARLGVVPAVISPFVLPRIGVAAARELFLTGETFDAAIARDLGLVSLVVPESELDGAVAERVGALLQAAPGAQAAIKRLIPFVSSHPSGVRERTAHLTAERRASDEGREGLTAFLERRQPRWAEKAAPFLATSPDFQPTPSTPDEPD